MKFLVFPSSIKVLGTGLLSCQILWDVGLVWAAEVKPAWQSEWERTLEAAKKEGRLVLLTVDGFSTFFQEFQKRFPHVKVVQGFSGSVAERTQILLAERRAGVYRFDISFGSPAHTEISMHVKKGKDLMGVIRDPEKTKSFIFLPLRTTSERYGASVEIRVRGAGLKVGHSRCLKPC